MSFGGSGGSADSNSVKKRDYLTELRELKGMKKRQTNETRTSETSKTPRHNTAAAIGLAALQEFLEGKNTIHNTTTTLEGVMDVLADRTAGEPQTSGARTHKTHKTPPPEEQDRYEHLAFEALRDLCQPWDEKELKGLFGNSEPRWLWGSRSAFEWQRAAKARGVSEEDFYPAAQALIDRGDVVGNQFGFNSWTVPGGITQAGWEEIARYGPHGRTPLTRIRKDVFEEIRPGVTQCHEVDWETGICPPCNRRLKDKYE